jgi:hypothetical protein
MSLSSPSDLRVHISPTQVAQPGTLQQVEAAEERMALSPERLLLTALESPDLHSLPDVILQDVPQNVFSFTLDGAPVKVYLNAYTHLPTAIDYSGPLAHSNFWNYLGDVTMRIYCSFWWLAKNGIHMPLQWNVEENGLQDSMSVIRKLQIDEAKTDPLWAQEQPEQQMHHLAEVLLKRELYPMALSVFKINASIDPKSLPPAIERVEAARKMRPNDPKLEELFNSLRDFGDGMVKVN